MKTPEQLAAAWIAYARVGHDNASEKEFVEGWELVEMAEDDPSVGWEAIKLVVDHYSEEDLISEGSTEAQRVVGRLAAGPIEDLLGHHGPDFIEEIEAEAGRDPRMAWALGGVWQFLMSDEMYARVTRVAGGSEYWSRIVGAPKASAY